MESLQMLKYSVYRGASVNFTEGMDWSDELKEFEFTAQTETTGDPDSYARNLGTAEDEFDTLQDSINDVHRNLEAIEETEEETDN